MAAADPGGPGARDTFLGFHSYADDTPRTDLEGAAYPAHDDLSVAPPGPDDAAFRDSPLRERRRDWPMAAGVAVLVLAAGAGVTLARRDIARPAPAPAAPQVASAAPTASSQQSASSAQVASAQQTAPSPQVAPPPAAPNAAPTSSRASERPVIASVASRRPAAPVPATPGADPVGDTLARILRDLPSEPTETAASASPAASASDRATVATAQAPSAPLRASFDCRYPRSYAQRMVCGDPDLAAQDRRMSRAYVAALAAGVPQDQLRAEQSDWLSLREDAARRSPQALHSIYEQRINDLWALATGRPE